MSRTEKRLLYLVRELTVLADSIKSKSSAVRQQLYILLSNVQTDALYNGDEPAAQRAEGSEG